MVKQDKVSIKGTKQGLVIRFPEDVNLERALRALDLKLASSGSFFQGSQVWVELPSGAGEPGGPRACAAAVTVGDLRKLEEIASRHGLVLAGLMVGQAADNGQGDRPTTAASAGPTLLVRRTLRSGQTVRYSGSVVVLGDVNAGAEIEAAGDIVVFGKLRGVAHAGFPDKETRVVAALRLEPTQLRIGRVIARPPDAPRAYTSDASPEVASVASDGAIEVVSLSGWTTRQATQQSGR